MSFCSFPNDLLLYVTSFLSEHDQMIFGSCCVKFSQDLLLNHLRVFKIMVEGNYAMVTPENKTITTNFLRRYDNDSEIREKFAKLILNPEFQLHIFHSRFVHFPQPFPFPRIYSISTDFNIFQSRFFEIIKKVHHLKLDIHLPLNLPDPLHLPEEYGLKSLNLQSFHSLTLLPVIPLPVILPQSLESLTLNGRLSPLPIDSFSHLQELCLFNNDTIDNVGMLVNIPKLKLVSCSRIVDITPLQRTRDIYIGRCNGILDYRNALTYSLWIRIDSPNQKAVIDVSSFKAVQRLLLYSVSSNSSIVLPYTLKRLMISGFNVQLTTTFNYLQELTVAGSTILTNVACFGCIPILHLASLLNVTSLNGLGYDEDLSKNLRNRKVSLTMINVEDFTPLNSVSVVSIRQCDGFRDIGQVKDVKNLSIAYCPNCHFSTAVMSEQLTLRGKMDDDIFRYMPNVKELDISFTTGAGIENWEALNTLRNLQRVILPKKWKEEETEIWEILRQDYLRFDQFDQRIDLQKVNYLTAIVLIKKR